MTDYRMEEIVQFHKKRTEDIREHRDKKVRIIDLKEGDCFSLKKYPGVPMMRSSVEGTHVAAFFLTGDAKGLKWGFHDDEEVDCMFEIKLKEQDDET